MYVKTPQKKFSHFLSKRIGKAIMDYRMLDDGDRILVAVSGGKDSLTMLHILEQRRKFVPIRYELIPVYVDLGYSKKQRAIVESYLREQGYDFRIIEDTVVKRTKKEDINCFWCAWNRRKVLFETAAQLKCTKVALGHHKDDIIQTFLLNLAFQGEISAMVPRQELFKGKVVLIRPLAYVEERETERFAREHNFPVSSCACAHAGKTQRHHVGRLIRELEKVSPHVKTNIFRSLQRVKREYLL